MKRIISILIALILSVSEARAQTTPFSGTDFANTCGLSQTCGANLSSAASNVYNTQGTPAAIATGSSINIQSGFQAVYPLPAILTPSTSYPTPASAAGAISARYNIVASSGPTAMFVVYPQATTLPANVRAFGIFNQSANPVALVPYPGDTFNALAAATPFSCTTLKYCECLKLTATNWGCTIQ
jgi:hypothetical protein